MRRRRPLRKRPGSGADSLQPHFRLMAARAVIRPNTPPPAALFDSDTPEPAEELPDSDLSEREWRDAMARETWRRQRRD